jgi:hypothetical protein
MAFPLDRGTPLRKSALNTCALHSPGLAWLIVASLKDVENRSRRVSHRGPVLIHASKQMATTPVHEIEQRVGVAIPESELRFGGVIGIAAGRLRQRARQPVV